MEKVLESFLTLVARLQVIEKNGDICIALRAKYRPVFASTNSNNKEKAGSEIAQILRPIYKTYRDNVIEKDFSFLLEDEAKDGFIVHGKSIGLAYGNIIAGGSDEDVKKVTNGLLHLFFLVAPEGDQKEIEDRHAKKEEVSKKHPNFAALGPGRPNTSIAHKMEKLLDKHKDSLKRAENDPAAISGVLGDFFHENSRDMAGILTNILGNTGVLNGTDATTSQ